MKPNPIFPSILSTGFFELQHKLQQFGEAGIDFIHLDVMDGHFVDNLSFGPSAVRAIKARFPFKMDSHLMVSNPEKMIPKFIESGSDWISFHLEASRDVTENIATIRQAGKGAGLVLNPDTDPRRVFPFLKAIDYLLLMSVYPGYGGQTFIPQTLDRVRIIKNEIESQQSPCLIQVDGGINVSIVTQLLSAGADLFVIGTSLYGAEDIPGTVEGYLRTIEGVTS